VKRITTYGAHAVVVFAFTKEAYNNAPSLLRPEGTLVAVGLPHGSSVQLATTPSALVFGCLHIVGSLTGTLKDVEEALDFTARGLVHVSVQVSRIVLLLTCLSQADSDDGNSGRSGQVYGADDCWQGGRACLAEMFVKSSRGMSISLTVIEALGHAQDDIV
jgi:hypothetical protein